MMASFFSEASISAINFNVGKRHIAKDGAKPEYPNLFKGRQPYRLKIHEETLRRSLSKS